MLSQQLGRGSSGVVLAAEDARLGRVAIEFMHSEDRGEAEREAALMQRVAHEHVCKLFEHALIADSLHAMVIELLTKGSLEEVRTRSADGRICEFECVRMASHILSALTFMHSRDVMHRDVKPSNVMLTKGAEEGRKVFKLIDLSVSAIEQTAQGQVSDTLATSTTGLQAQVGTPHYMSPEQITASVGVTPQTDLWSLGVVLYECLSGVKPFVPGVSDDFKIAYAVVNTKAKMLPDVIAEVGIVSDKMAAFVSHSLRKDLSDRFQTADAMNEALEMRLTTRPLGRSTDRCGALATSAWDPTVLREDSKDLKAAASRVPPTPTRPTRSAAAPATGAPRSSRSGGPPAPAAAGMACATTSRGCARARQATCSPFRRRVWSIRATRTPARTPPPAPDMAAASRTSIRARAPASAATTERTVLKGKGRAAPATVCAIKTLTQACAPATCYLRRGLL